jgi:hypothetical protein
MRLLNLLPKAGPVTLVTGFLMVILLGAFVITTYQQAFAAEPNKADTGDMKGNPPSKPCSGGGDPVLCVGVAVNPAGNELGCNLGQQCSLSTQNKPCGAPGSGKTCQTEVYPVNSETCRCICKN